MGPNDPFAHAGRGLHVAGNPSGAPEPPASPVPFAPNRRVHGMALGLAFGAMWAWQGLGAAVGTVLAGVVGYAIGGATFWDRLDLPGALRALLRPRD